MIDPEILLTLLKIAVYTVMGMFVIGIILGVIGMLMTIFEESREPDGE